MFDPWIQCDDLDLGAILHQANTVVSSASSSSTSGSSLSSHSSSLSSSCSPSSSSPGSSKSPSCANSPRSLQQPSSVIAAVVPPDQQPLDAGRFDQAPAVGLAAQLGQQTQQAQVGFFCPSLADEPGHLSAHADEKRSPFNMLTGNTMFHSNQVQPRQMPSSPGRGYHAENQQSSSIPSSGQLVSSAVQQQQPPPPPLDAAVGQEHERNLLIGQQHLVTACSVSDIRSANQVYQQTNQIDQCDNQDAAGAQQSQQQLQHLQQPQTAHSQQLQQQQHQHQQQQARHQNARPHQAPTGQKIRRCRHITDYVLAEEEKRLLIKEGYSDFPMTCQARPLSKTEERILRKIRRKIRNKKSAQCSRQRKKEYVEDLERKYAAVVRENGELKDILDRIQQQQQHQSQQPQQHSNISLYRSICLQ